jgi:hypothetical protein
MEIYDFSASEPAALEKFYAVAQQVYAHDPLWVPQSEAAVGKLFASAGQIFVRPVMAEDDGQPLARAVAILVAGAVDDQQRPRGYIGCFECLEQHPSAGQAVLRRAEQLLQAQGAASVQAPRVDNMLMGLVIGPQPMPQTVWTPHNPPYYADILTSSGYTQREQLLTYIFDRSCAINLPFQSPGVRTRCFDRQNLAQEIAVFHHLQQEIFTSHPGWVQRSLEEDRQMIEGFLPVLDDEMVIIAEDQHQRPIGLLVCIPDVYQAFRGQQIDNARLISIGALPASAHKGIGVMMGLHLMRNLLKKGYQTLEASWVRDSNFSPQNLARRFKARPGRLFAIYEKRLG